MKKIMKTLTLIGLLAGALGVGTFTPLQRDNVEAEAATVETKRVWVKVATGSGTWFSNDGARLFIHLYVGGTNNGWPGQQVILEDSPNGYRYFDAPSNYTNFIFTRVAETSLTVWNELPSNVIGPQQHQWFCTINTADGGVINQSWIQNTSPSTTNVVSKFAATIDTREEACSAEKAQAAVNAYNNLSTFEQDQFDVLDVGGGVKGLQRLNFLKDFYNIDTSLNVSPFGFQDSSKYSWLVIGIGTLGFFALLSYFFVTKKKHYN